MAIDLEAIRKKIAQLNGVKNSRVQLWKPPVGEHRIRVLPWPDATSEQPFKELFFYYLGKRMPILAPFQFNKPDPIHDFIKSLYASRTDENRELAYKLKPAMRAYVPIIDRANEKQGPIVWAFGKKPYQRMLGFYVDPDVGDFTDPQEGLDLKVDVIPGTGFSKTLIGSIDAARKQSVLHSDPDTMKKWLDSIPSIGDMYPIKSADEIKSELEAYLAGDEGEGPRDNQGETTKGADAPPDELEKIASELKSKKPPVDEESVPEKKAGKSKKEEKKNESEPKYKNLDKAFSELLDEDSSEDK